MTEETGHTWGNPSSSLGVTTLGATTQRASSGQVACPHLVTVQAPGVLCLPPWLPLELVLEERVDNGVDNTLQT